MTLPSGIQDTADRRPPANARLILILLLCINTVNFFDRQVLPAVTEPLRHEWGLTDTQIGWLGTAFTLLYAVVGLPLGRLADQRRRTRLLALGVALWSALTFASGLCRNFVSLFAARLGVGVGEAACAPTAASLIGDLFPPLERARAMSVFMLGLPAGLALSYVVSGAIAQHFGWRYAFFVAGMPGLFLAMLIWRAREPARGWAEAVPVGAARRPGSPYIVVLGLPTMWIVIVSGALHNFNLYGISAFLPALLTRYHGESVQSAGVFSGLIIGAMGAVGMLAGGWLGDAAMRRRADGRMLVAAASLLLSAPVSWLALQQPA
ncbi:MAG: MFS transporter, partial [Deltaproteobacteria bacterium]|nr:MFS transporter [Deltaproteobacteria bacterium]